MEVVSHLSGVSINSGEPLMTLWARGKERLLPAGSSFVDISDAKKSVIVNKGVIRDRRLVPASKDTRGGFLQ